MSNRSPLSKRSASPIVASRNCGLKQDHHYHHHHHHSSKRYRQLAAGTCCDGNSQPSNKAQLSTAFRRAQSANGGVFDANHLTRSELQQWREREDAVRPNYEHFGRVQTEVTPAMRTVLVDWLGEVRDEFQLHSETLFLTVSYLDRYLGSKFVARQSFQLLGLACLWVAAKFEEVYPPTMLAMLAMAENMYSPNEMRAMEKEVLFTLDFTLAVPTSLRFLHYILQLAPLPPQQPAALSVARLSEALLELTLLDTAFLVPAPCKVAAGAAYLSLKLLGYSEALRAVALASEVEPQELGVLVQSLSAVLQAACAQPQPCALLLRYRDWERLHVGQEQGWSGDRQTPPPPPSCAPHSTANLSAAVPPPSAPAQPTPSVAAAVVAEAVPSNDLAQAPPDDQASSDQASVGPAPALPSRDAGGINSGSTGPRKLEEIWVASWSTPGRPGHPDVAGSQTSRCSAVRVDVDDVVKTVVRNSEAGAPRVVSQQFVPCSEHSVSYSPSHQPGRASLGSRGVSSQMIPVTWCSSLNRGGGGSAMAPPCKVDFGGHAARYDCVVTSAALETAPTAPGQPRCSGGGGGGGGDCRGRKLPRASGASNRRSAENIRALSSLTLAAATGAATAAC